ncbi:MAG: DUF2934 domain-containing protein [Sulfuricella sp.]
MNEHDNKAVSGGKTSVEGNQAPAPAKHHFMIAEAAYYRAECRGFLGGDPVADWLEAEAEIEAMLGSSGEERKRSRKSSKRSSTSGTKNSTA